MRDARLTPAAGDEAASLAASCAFFFLLAAALPAGALGEGRTLRDVVFTDYGEQSSNPELVRRLLSPLAAARLAGELARGGRAITGQPVNLADERFVVYVPPRHAASGYGLMVFVPPWQDARIPPGWTEMLDRFGLIYVSAARSGNEESALGRREPLALLAAYNVRQRHAVDPERVLIAGFSGGSRVALRLALGYPDLFRGAVLNAGSDPIGNAELPLPPRELLIQLQSTTRLVYVTGERDSANAYDDLRSIRSLRQWCVFNVEGFLEPRAGHEVASAAALSRALGILGAGTQPDPAKVAGCRSQADAALDATLRKVESAIQGGRGAKARRLLEDADERFGGLAAPRSLELASRL